MSLPRGGVKLYHLVSVRCAYTCRSSKLLVGRSRLFNIVIAYFRLSHSQAQQSEHMFNCLSTSLSRSSLRARPRERESRLPRRSSELQLARA